MNITPSQTGYEHIMVFLAIQGAKEGIITSEYSGTMRLADYVAPEAFIKKCIDAWCLYALSTYPTPPAGELLFTVPTLAAGDTDAIFADMLVKGYLTYDSAHNVYDFSALNRIFGYTITSEANIPDYGILAWGVDGLGATYASSDVGPVLIDAGVTMEQYMSQFPQHNVTGSDIIIVYPGSNALSRLVDGWKPQLKDIVFEIRSHIPVVNPTP
ncbi:hypothetical protein [Salmonella phage S115]|uniref:DUF7270 domain-containing protein n=2 Tax=Kuttervirus TaxID=2169536 RepID=A0A2Z5HMU3_9CAUD|nr:hypothetical protein HYP66_gp090 [Salmonella phage S118]YP_009887417.1 putative structural protein [Salmonella phage rabagast]AXC40441.1 hypothetical protein [Salmonella phage S115]AXC41007.1 hypothetical protein [Salmonella phage S118]QIQ61758.1 putative structural protein [Salmonella phage rabagast]